MKRLILLTLSLVLLVASIKTNAQVLITKNDSIPLGQDSIVKIILPEARGNIQWQKSLDTKSWINMESETKDTLLVKSNTEAMYRAVVTEGACLPVHSDTVGVVSQDTISTNYITPYSAGFNLISDSTSISEGKYIYSGTNQSTDFVPGKVIIDEQSKTIRKITDILFRGDTIITFTEQATMEDLFYGTSFKLSTSMVQPTQNLKSASLEEISKLLTDENGFIHPVSITMYDEMGTKLKSASIYDKDKNSDENNALYWHFDLNTELWDFNGEGILPDKEGNFVKLNGKSKCYFSDSYITLDPEFKFEFDYERPKFNWDEMKISRGELTKFKFYSDESIFDIKMVIAKETDISFTVGKKISLLPEKLKVTMYYQIGPVPLWIDYEMDFVIRLSASLSAGSNDFKGFQNKTYLTLGVGYENKEWYIFDDIFNNYTPISYGSVHGATEFKVDLYPSAVMKFYSVAGPFYEAGPYAKYELVNSLTNNSDSHIGLGYDCRVGVLAGFMDYDFFKCSFTKNLFEKTIWESPGKLVLVSGDEQSAIIGKQLSDPIKVKVLTSNDSPVNGAQVYFRPLQGKVENEIVVTNDEGIASSNWTMSDISGINRMEVFTKNGRDEEMHELKLDIKATAEIAPITLPSVGTVAVTNVGLNTATISSIVTSDGGAEVTVRGVCYSPSQEPTLERGESTEDYKGTGSFTSLLFGLATDRDYYVRAYAKNSQGIAYGNQLTFRTRAGLSIPSVTTNTVIDITQTTATSGGKVTSDGGTAIIAQGVCWSTTPEPTIVNNPNKTTDALGVTGFISKITGLTAGKIYYVRAYATNSMGTGFGEQVTFTAASDGGTGTLEYDGRTYKTVIINGKEWMAENLAYLPSVNPPGSDSYTEPRYYVFGYFGSNVTTAKNSANYSNYGVLYNWPAAKSSCPPGWHLPSDAEWKELEIALGMTESEANQEGARNNVVANKMKSAAYWGGGSNGNNLSGLNIRPSGNQSPLYGGSFHNDDDAAIFFTATSYNTENAWTRAVMDSRFPGVHRGYNPINQGFSVRCIKDY